MSCRITESFRISGVQGDPKVTIPKKKPNISVKTMFFNVILMNMTYEHAFVNGKKSAHSVKIGRRYSAFSLRYSNFWTTLYS